MADLPDYFTYQKLTEFREADLCARAERASLAKGAGLHPAARSILVVPRRRLVGLLTGIWPRRAVQRRAL